MCIFRSVHIPLSRRRRNLLSSRSERFMQRLFGAVFYSSIRPFGTWQRAPTETHGLPPPRCVQRSLLLLKLPYAPPVGRTDRVKNHCSNVLSSTSVLASGDASMFEVLLWRRGLSARGHQPNQDPQSPNTGREYSWLHFNHILED